MVVESHNLTIDISEHAPKAQQIYNINVQMDSVKRWSEEEEEKKRRRGREKYVIDSIFVDGEWGGLITEFEMKAW